MDEEELPSETHERITHLCKEGDDLLKQNRDHESLDKYYEAWELIPEPKAQWEATTWVLTAMGEVYLKNKRLDKARHAFRSAVQCPGGLGNPYIHLRLGQIAFDSSDLDSAADELTRAYMGAGEKIFSAEDSKYLAFLRTKIKM